jgi:hypothetical protein
MKSKSLLASMAAMSSTMACAAELPNLIVNGSFEQGWVGGNDGPCKRVLSGGSTTIPGWTVVGGSYCIDWYDTSTGCSENRRPASEGVLYLDLKGSYCESCNNNGGVRQDVPTMPMNIYSLILDHRGTNSGNDDIGIEIENTIDTFRSNMVDPEWETIAISFVATDGSTRLHIFSPQHQSGSGLPGLDNVRLHDGDCNNDGVADLDQIADGTLTDTDGSFVPDCCEQGTDCSPCLGNLTKDNQVNAADLGILLAVWGDSAQFPAADINGDGHVNAADLGLLLSNWGPCPGG